MLGWNACAAEVEGVKLSDTLHIGEHDLLLNGAGVRSKFFFDMYVAALYLTDKNGSSDAILSGPGENRVAMHMLRDISSETLSKSFNKSINLNLSLSERAELDVQLKQFAVLFSMMSEAKKGDVITLDYLPGQGTAVNFNDVTIGRIEGAAFNVALLKVWLGNKPVQENLKKQLLGGQ
jgi:flagellar motor switch/type III secretory pathway protein FliN